MCSLSMDHSISEAFRASALCFVVECIINRISIMPCEYTKQKRNAKIGLLLADVVQYLVRI